MEKFWCAEGRELSSPRRAQFYSATELANALCIPLLDDEIILRVVLPLLAGSQKSIGFVPLQTLHQTIANVLTDGVSSALCFTLHQFQIDQLIFKAELQHEHPEQARIFCSCLSVDPWNSLSPVSGCVCGNFNQVGSFIPYCMDTDCTVVHRLL